MEYQKFIPEGWETSKPEFSLNNIKEAISQGKVVQGLAYKCDDNYNIHVKLNDSIDGIIPRNEIDFLGVDDDGNTKIGICKNKINNFVQFKMKKIFDDNQVLLSRKEVCKEALNWANTELKPGMVVNGIVKNIRPYGVFVEIGGGVVGLIHIQDISVSRMKNPSERFFIGQKIKTMIKLVDKENSRIILSYKELLGNWDDNIKEFQEKTVVKGIVKEYDKFKNGIFIELKPNLVGLAEYKSGYKYGQEVNVFIKKIIQDKKKIKLLIV